MRMIFHRLSFVRLLLLLVVCIFLATSGVWAQTTSGGGTLQGLVRDENGAAIPNATVKITSLATGTTSTLVTTSAGLFVTPTVNIGRYKVRIEATGMKAWEGQVLFSEPERAAFRHLLELGLKDAFRLFEQPEKIYSWWDYRMMAFRRNRGLRIDHILLSEALASNCTACAVDKEARKAERPSDHAPVMAELE